MDYFYFVKTYSFLLVTELKKFMKNFTTPMENYISTTNLKKYLADLNIKIKFLKFESSSFLAQIIKGKDN